MTEDMKKTSRKMKWRADVSDELSLRQVMLRHPFFYEFTDIKTRFRPVDHFHRELAFLLQDAGVEVGDERHEVRHTKHGDIYAGTMSGSPSVKLTMAKNVSEIGLGSVLVVLGAIVSGIGMLSFLGWLGPPGGFSSLILAVPGLICMAAGLIKGESNVKVLTAPYSGEYKIMYVGYVPKVPEHPDIPYEQPDYMVVRVAHSFQPTEGALRNPEVQERTKYFDYITARIQKQLAAEPRDMPPPEQLHAVTSLLIPGHITEYDHPTERDVLDEVLDRWPLHESRYVDDSPQSDDLESTPSRSQ